ncbi:MAG: ABC transporter permease [Oscillospiraceae bacterium]|nr:ABC transporter permease [Oscillospiraceae bacterium]
MANIIRADLYRISKGKGLYIAIAAFLATLILLVTSNGMGSIGVDVAYIQDPEYVPYGESVVVDDDGVETITPNREEIIMTGVLAPKTLADSTSDLIYFILPFIVIIAAADFSTGAAKNLISSGLSRKQYFFSKFISVGIISFMMCFIFVVLSVLIATIMNGFGGSFNMTFIKETAEIYLPQAYLIFAYACLGLFVTFTLKSKSALISIYVAFSLVPILLVIILGDINEKFYNLLDYEMVFNIKSFAYSAGIIPPDLTRALLLGGAYIFLSAIGGFLLFRKAEIK